MPKQPPAYPTLTPGDSPVVMRIETTKAANNTALIDSGMGFQLLHRREPTVNLLLETRIQAHVPHRGSCQECMSPFLPGSAHDDVVQGTFGYVMDAGGVAPVLDVAGQPNRFQDDFFLRSAQGQDKQDFKSIRYL